MEQSRANYKLNTTVLIAFHLAIALPLAYILNIWSDEASTLYSTQHGFMYAFQFAGANEKQAPLYFWVLSLWRLVDGSIFFARLFSVICSVVAIRVFGNLASLLFDQRGALLATAFFALHPFLLWASLEIRVYSLVILLTVILVRLFWNTFITDENERLFTRRGLWFLIAAVVALYTNYYLGFVLVGLFAALLASARRRAARSYLLSMAAAGAAVLPLALSIGHQFAGVTGGYQDPRPLIEGLQYIWNHFLTFILPAEIFPGEEASPFAIFRVWMVRALILLAVVLAISKRSTIGRRTIMFGVASAAIAILLLTAYFLLGHIYVEVRHASILLVPVILLSASAISDLMPKFTERTTAAVSLTCGLLVLASFSYSLLNLYPQGVKRGDWARIGRFIEENEVPGQPIVVFTTFDALALPYHYHGVNQIVPDERFFEFELEAPFGSDNSLGRQTDFVISEIPATAQTMWLAVNEKCLATDACRPLQNFVQANYTIELEKEFYLEKLYLLRKKQ